MKPENRKSTVPTRTKLTVIRRSDTSAVDTVKGLASDITYSSCVGCQKSTLDTNACSHCHRAICDRCSGACENCLYHFCPVCRTVKYETARNPIAFPFELKALLQAHRSFFAILVRSFDLTHFDPDLTNDSYEGHGDSTFCLSCNEDLKDKRRQEEQDYENTENAMDCDY